MTVTDEQAKNIRDFAEDLFGYSPCLHCVNKGAPGSGACRAFSRIPDEIFWGKNLHTEQYPGDHGIRFESE